MSTAKTSGSVSSTSLTMFRDHRMKLRNQKLGAQVYDNVTDDSTTESSLHPSSIYGIDLNNTTATDFANSSASSTCLPSAIEEASYIDHNLEKHFVGPMQPDEAATKVKLDDFLLYYRLPSASETQVPENISLYIVHKNTKNEIFHFPVVRIADKNGSRWWIVQLNNACQKLRFRQLSDLVRCYHTYRYTDVRTGRMEAFPTWRGGVIDAE